MIGEVWPLSAHKEINRLAAEVARLESIAVSYALTERELIVERDRLKQGGQMWADECRKAQDYAMRLRAALAQIIERAEYRMSVKVIDDVVEIARRALEGK